jgi:hypothetical protein
MAYLIMLSLLWQGTAVFFFGQIECSGAKRVCRVILRKPSESWRIDAGRIVRGGASAGGIISEYLAYQNDYAVLESDDKVSHMSSHPNVVVSLRQPWRTKEIIIPLMDAGEAPVFLYSNAPPKDKIHPPWAAEVVYKKAHKLGVPTSVYGGDRNQLPQVDAGTTWLNLSVEFCQKHLDASSSSEPQ